MAAARLKVNAEREDKSLSLPPRETGFEPGDDDALGTLMQWLYTKMTP